MHVRITAAALVLLGAAACDRGSTTEPEPALAVQVTTAATSQLSAAQDGSALISCEIGMNVTAAGDEGTAASWRGGMLRYFIAQDSVAVDSLELSARDVRGIFGDDPITPGFTGSNTLQLVSPVPFSVQVELDYLVTGRQQEDRAAATAACGPRPAPGARPSVSNVSVTGPANGELQPGDTLTITWTAQSPLGLWETGVQVSGAFSHATRSARFATTDPVTSTVQVVVPPGARLGGRVQVLPFAVDVALQSGTGPAYTSPPVVDRIPPVLQAVRTALPGAEWGTSLVGQYGDRDTVELHAIAHDNHQLAYAVYELGGQRDSIAVMRQGLGIVDILRIPLRAGMTGDLAFRMYFRDVAGNRTSEAAAQPGAMRVYPVRDVNVRSASVPGWGQDVLVDPARGRVYSVVANHEALYIHRLADMTLERTVPLPLSATALELTADGDSLLVSSRYYGGIVVMPVNATAAPAVRRLEGVAAVNGIRIAHTGRAIALTEMSGGGLAVLEVDLGAGTQRLIAAGLEVPDAWEGVTRSRDRRRMLLGAGCVFDVQTERVGTCRLMRSGILAGSVHGDEVGERWGRLHAVYGPDLRPVLQIGEPAAQFMAGIIPLAGGGAYAASRRGLVRVGPDGGIAERLAAPPLGYMRLSDDGTWMAAWEVGTAAEGGYRIRVLELR